MPDIVSDMEKNLWWGYLHVRGTLQAKRYFDKRDLDEAYESDFVAQVVQPFMAKDREEALDHVRKYTSWWSRSGIGIATEPGRGLGLVITG